MSTEENFIRPHAACPQCSLWARHLPLRRLHRVWVTQSEEPEPLEELLTETADRYIPAVDYEAFTGILGFPHIPTSHLYKAFVVPGLPTSRPY